MHGAAPVKAFERFMCLPNFFQNCAFDDFVYLIDTQKSVGPGRGGAGNNGNTPIGE